MAINFDSTIFSKMIVNYSKSLTYTPVTKTTNNFGGSETLTDGTPSTIAGAFYKKEDAYTQSQVALLKGADAILMVLSAVTINKDDKITYQGETFRVEESEPRRLGTTSMYNVARLFLI